MARRQWNEWLLSNKNITQKHWRFDSSTIDITQEFCSISDGDTEGIRRGIYELEDISTRLDGPFIEPMSIHRSLWLENRINRGFLSPVKKAPVYMVILYGCI